MKLTKNMYCSCDCKNPGFNRVSQSSLPTRYPHMKWASMGQNLSSGVCEQQRADQPAHPRRMISAFVNHLLECIIYTQKNN